MSINRPGRGEIELLVVLLGLMIQSQFANAQDEAVDEPFTVEYYYKVKWGYFAEFYELYKHETSICLNSGNRSSSHRLRNYSADTDDVSRAKLGPRNRLDINSPGRIIQ